MYNYRPDPPKNPEPKKPDPKKTSVDPLSSQAKNIFDKEQGVRNFEKSFFFNFKNLAF